MPLIAGRAHCLQRYGAASADGQPGSQPRYMSGMHVSKVSVKVLLIVIVPPGLDSLPRTPNSQSSSCCKLMLVHFWASRSRRARSWEADRISYSVVRF